MTKDLNKGITSIQYNSLNLPQQMDIKSPIAEARNEYTYSVVGQKLKVVQKWNPDFSTTPVIGSTVNATSLTQTKTTDYVGNKVYENNVLKRILVDGGYIEGNTYHFYQTDHLGNRYNGKELDQMHGLNLYDYSARYYESSIGRFTTVDPLAEKYYSISPYVYVMNNPLKYIDPTRMYSTEEWKRDNGVTDDDLYTVYQSPQDGDPEKNKSNSSSPISILGNIKKSFSALGNFNISSTIGEFAMNLFSIKESVTTSDGEKYDKYIKRTYENSGPDYLGVDIGYSLTFWGLPGLSHALGVDIGYVKNDGWVIFPTFKSSSGFDISLGGDIVIGSYLGKGVPQAKSLGGFGSYTSYTRGIINYGYSRGYDNNFNHSWNFFSIGAGKGIPKSWSTQIGVTITPNPHYLRDFNCSN